MNAPHDGTQRDSSGDEDATGGDEASSFAGVVAKREAKVPGRTRHVAAAPGNTSGYTGEQGGEDGGDDLVSAALGVAKREAKAPGRAWEE